MAAPVGVAIAGFESGSTTPSKDGVQADELV